MEQRKKPSSDRITVDWNVKKQKWRLTIPGKGEVCYGKVIFNILPDTERYEEEHSAFIRGHLVMPEGTALEEKTPEIAVLK